MIKMRLVNIFPWETWDQFSFKALKPPRANVVISILIRKRQNSYKRKQPLCICVLKFKVNLYNNSKYTRGVNTITAASLRIPSQSLCTRPCHSNLPQEFSNHASLLTITIAFNVYKCLNGESLIKNFDTQFSHTKVCKRKRKRDSIS